MVQLHLMELSFDLQVQICEFLQPPEILALRQTSKAFHQVTSQRIIWIHALKHICHDNFLFLPIDDMSIAELERAATAPFRWIALSSSTARNDSDVLQLRITRTIKNPIASAMNSKFYLKPWKAYLVPGGRYLVISGWRFLGVWDLGNVSDSEDGRVIGMWKAGDGFYGAIDFIVHPTSDGRGIRILATPANIYIDTFYVFEAYPQQEAPKLAKVAKFTLNNRQSMPYTYCLNGNHAVIYVSTKGTIIVWDFMANTVASWSTVPAFRVVAQIVKVTETVIIIDDAGDRLLIFDIPPLKANKTLFDINEDPPIVTPLITPYTNQVNHARVSFRHPDSWYSGDPNSLPLCIDMSQGNKERRWKFDITSDFSTIHLVPIAKEWERPRQCIGDYRICNDRLVNAFCHSKSELEVNVCGGFGLSSNGQAHNLIRAMCFTLPSAHTYSSFCPASARFVFIVENNIAIADLL